MLIFDDPAEENEWQRPAYILPIFQVYSTLLLNLEFIMASCVISSDQLHVPGTSTRVPSVHAVKFSYFKNLAVPVPGYHARYGLTGTKFNT